MCLATSYCTGRVRLVACWNLIFFAWYQFLGVLWCHLKVKFASAHTKRSAEQRFCRYVLLCVLILRYIYLCPLTHSLTHQISLSLSLSLFLLSGVGTTSFSLRYRPLCSLVLHLTHKLAILRKKKRKQRYASVVVIFPPKNNLKFFTLHVFFVILP